MRVLSFYPVVLVNSKQDYSHQSFFIDHFRILGSELELACTRGLRTVPNNKEVFFAVYDYAGKVDLSKAYWNPKRKLGVTTLFLKIIKQQYF